MKKLLIAATGSVAIVKLKRTIELLKKEFEIKLIVSNYVLKNFDGIEDLKPIIENTNLDTFPEHIKLAKWADQIIVLPASTNTIAKFHAGISDNPLLSTLIAARQNIIFVPAMNTYMYEALNKRNIISNLSKEGHMFIGPVVGMLKEGEVGLGRMAEPEYIFESIKNYFNPTKKKVVLTYGASKTYIDPIRYISNDSSGTMGKVLANQLRLSGYDVKTIDVSKYSNDEVVEIANSFNFDIYIGVAALADFTIKQEQDKISKKSNNVLNLSFKHDTDVIVALKVINQNKQFIAFKHSDDKEAAINKMKENQFNKIIWNKIGSMGKDLMTGAVIDNNNEVTFKNMTKLDLAKLIVKEM